MDYTEFAGLNVRIITNGGIIYEGHVWGFSFADETDENVLEVWIDLDTIDVEDIASIEECEE